MTPAWYQRPAHLAVVSVVVTAGAVAALIMGPALSDPEDASVTGARITKLPATQPAVPTESPTRTAPKSRSTDRPGSEHPDAANSTPEFDRDQHSTTDPSSPWVVVNKRRGLDPAYSPALATVRGTQVSTAVAPALNRLLEAADELDLALDVASGYRSYTRQEVVYSRSVAQRGADHADTVSARPGHSEHQTGLAVDITTAHAPGCTLHPCFGETAAGKWLAEEGWRYGFIVRYTGDNSDVTGFAHEPWHLRWVGRPLAREMRRTRTTSLEEFFGVAGGDYDDSAGAGGS